MKGSNLLGEGWLDVVAGVSEGRFDPDVTDDKDAWGMDEESVEGVGGLGDEPEEIVPPLDKELEGNGKLLLPELGGTT